MITSARAGVVVLAAVLFAGALAPADLAAALAFAPGAGVLRALSAQCVHWSIGLALLDAVVAIALGVWLAVLAPRRFVPAVVLGAGAVAAWLLTSCSVPYRGASGIASAIFCALALTLWRSPVAATRRAAGLALLLFAAKIAWEASGRAAPGAFALQPAGMQVAWQAHVTGGLGGLVAALFTGRG